MPHSSPEKKPQDLPTLARKAVKKVGRLIYERFEAIGFTCPMVSWPLEKLAGYGDWAMFDVKDDPRFLDAVRQTHPRKFATFAERLQLESVIGFSFYCNGELACWLWFSLGSFYEPEYRHTFELAPHEVYGFDLYLEPKYRQGLVPLAILHIAHGDMLKRGYTHTISMVGVDNVRSLYFHTRLKAKETGRKLLVHYIFRQPFAHEEPYDGKFMEHFLRERKALIKMRRTQHLPGSTSRSAGY